MSDPVETPAPPVFSGFEAGPFIYFDIAPTYGVMSGAVQVELAARVLIPTHEGGTGVAFACAGHLRCSPAAAQELIQALQKSLEMFQDLAAGGAPSGVAVN